MSQMTPSLDSLAWLVGDWQGNLGPLTVEETWYPPKHGSMQMMIRVSAPDSIQMLEFIVLQEIKDEDGKTALILHLRQFGEDMELRTNQEMRLAAQTATALCFVADDTDSVRQLDYTLVEDHRLKVDVTVTTGDVVTAELVRQTTAT